jgi:hypothetical protein
VDTPALLTSIATSGRPSTSPTRRRPAARASSRSGRGKACPSAWYGGTLLAGSRGSCLVTAAWLAERLGLLGFEPVAQTHRPYFHTRIPFLNLPTLDDHLERNGGLVALNEPFRWSSLRRPGVWWRG